MLINTLVLFAGSLIGILLGCRMYDYNTANTRKLGAALVFALLCIVTTYIPFPFIDIIVPLVGLYVVLVDDSYERGKVNKVFFVSLVSAVLTILLVYGLTGATSG